MKASVVGCASLLVIMAGFIVSCSDEPTVICPGLFIKATIPDTTTIKVGASTIAIAGYVVGGCEPAPPPDFVWQSSDSVVATVVAIDTIHARIQGRHPGIATITPLYRNGRQAPPPAIVTVVP